DVHGFAFPRPTLGPTVHIGPDHRGMVGHLEFAQMAVDLTRCAEVALDQGDRTCTAAEGLEPDCSRTGEQVKKWALGNRVAQNTEQGFPDHLRRWPEVFVNGARQLPTPKRASHDS